MFTMNNKLREAKAKNLQLFELNLAQCSDLTDTGVASITEEIARHMKTLTTLKLNFSK